MRKYSFSINNQPYNVLVKKFSADIAEMEVNGKSYSVEINEPVELNTVKKRRVDSKPVQPKPPVKLVKKPAAAPSPTKPQTPTVQPILAGDKTIAAPIPGSIIEIKVKVKDSIKKGQVVMKMEAMKMENEIFSDGDGIVEAIDVSEGDAVSQGQCLLRFG